MSTDPRLLSGGYELPTENYSDQPYVVRADDGAWLAIVTTGAGAEGSGGQHVVSRRSHDRGKSWCDARDLEPADGPEASYAALLKAPTGRIFAFYNHNTDHVRAVKADDPPYAGGLCARVDSLGHFVFRYTDDGGKSWSARRYDIPMRMFEIDRENADGGALLYFWNVGKPFVLEGRAYISVHKVGGFGAGFFTRSEGALLMSENLLTEPDADKIRFVTLPEGEIGLRAPEGGGPIAEEQSYVTLSDGSICAVYRTTDGHPAECVSRDGGRSFGAPRYRRFADGRRMKHPRAANFQWKLENGRYLYWFHNHGGHGYDDRNPAWICGGVETQTAHGREISWSQPEILLYDDDPMIRISYPDMIEEDGKVFITETQKDIARVHEIDAALIGGLWTQFEAPRRTSRGLLLDVAPRGESVAMPRLPDFAVRDERAPDYRSLPTRAGVTLELILSAEALEPGAELLSTLDGQGAGICVRAEADGALGVTFGDGATCAYWRTDALARGVPHHVTLIFDAGPHVVLVVADGALQDGAERQFGFGRFSQYMKSARGGALRAHAGVERVRVYGAALTVSEALGNQRAGERIGE